MLAVCIALRGVSLPELVRMGGALGGTVVFVRRGNGHRVPDEKEFLRVAGAGLITPWLIFLPTFLFAPTTWLYAAVGGEEGRLLGAVIWWWVVGFAVSATVLVRSRRMLSHFFRPAVADRS